MEGGISRVEVRKSGKMRKRRKYKTRRSKDAKKTAKKPVERVDGFKASWIHDLHWEVFARNMNYPAASPLADDPIRHYERKASGALAEAQIVLAKFVGCGTVSHGGLITFIGRESNLDLHKKHAPWISRSGGAVNVYENICYWLQYDDDFDLPLFLRRSTRSFYNRLNRIAPANVAWYAAGLFPALLEKLPPGGPIQVGGIFPIDPKSLIKPPRPVDELDEVNKWIRGEIRDCNNE